MWTGKTTLLNTIVRRGYGVINSDRIAHTIVYII